MTAKPGLAHRLVPGLLCILAFATASRSESAGAPAPPALPNVILQAGHGAVPLAVAWMNDGRHVVTGGDDGVIIIWDAITGFVVDRIPSPRGGADAGRRISVDTLLISGDDRYIAVISESDSDFSRKTLVFDRSTREAVWRGDGAAELWISGTHTLLLGAKGAIVQDSDPPKADGPIYHSRAVSMDEVGATTDNDAVVTLPDRAVQHSHDGRYVAVMDDGSPMAAPLHALTTPQGGVRMFDVAAGGEPWRPPAGFGPIVGARFTEERDTALQVLTRDGRLLSHRPGSGADRVTTLHVDGQTVAGPYFDPQRRGVPGTDHPGHRETGRGRPPRHFRSRHRERRRRRETYRLAAGLDRRRVSSDRRAVDIGGPRQCGRRTVGGLGLVPGQPRQFPSTARPGTTRRRNVHCFAAGRSDAT